jgi:hypothetical protein
LILHCFGSDCKVPVRYCSCCGSPLTKMPPVKCDKCGTLTKYCQSCGGSFEEFIEEVKRQTEAMAEHFMPLADDERDPERPKL